MLTPFAGGGVCIYQIKTNLVSLIPALAGGVWAQVALVTLDNLGLIACPLWW